MTSLVVVLGLVPAELVRAAVVAGVPSGVPAAPPDTPDQRTGSAAGKPHLVDAETTEAKPDAITRKTPAPDKAIAPEPVREKAPKSSMFKAPTPPALPGAKPRVVEETPKATVRGFDRTTSKEVPGKRSRFKTVFQNQDGTLTAEYGTTPRNFQKADKSWAKIDTTLVGDGGRWRVRADASDISLASRSDAASLASFELGDERRTAAFSLAGAAPVTASVDGDTATYSEVLPGTDLVLQPIPGGGVKEALVLQSVPATNVWKFPLTLSGVTARLDDTGAVELVATDGTIAGRIPKGYMEDSKRDPRSGDGVRSEGVTYRLLTEGGKTVLEVTADKAWLADPARVYPVTVDPTTYWNFTAPADTYVQTGYTTTTYTEHELRAGTYDAGAHVAATYMSFGNLATDLHNATIYGAQLYLYPIWSYSCSAARSVTVHDVTQSWSQTSIAAYPGPSFNATPIATSSPFARGYIAPGASSSACPSSWAGVPLGTAGKNLVQRWADGGTNNGITVRASTSDSNAWKKFASRDTINGPYMAVTYSPYEAVYSFPQNPPVINPAVTPTQAGYVPVTVANEGQDTWGPSNDYYLTYQVYDQAGNRVYHESAKTAPTSNVVHGYSHTFNARINPLPPGTWTVMFDMLHSVNEFHQWGVPRTAQLTVTIPDHPPRLNDMSPDHNYEVGTLRPQLSADADNLDGWPSSGVQYWFQICAGQAPNWDWCEQTPWQTSRTWQVPAGKLQWGKNYHWTVWVNDGSQTVVGPLYLLKTAVQQPAITSHLASGGTAGTEVNALIGNYTTTVTDASVASAGPPLSVVRTYNSLDPRTTSAFGAGWSTRFDMKVEPDNDGTGNVVVTYPDGQQVRFGRNADGSFTPPPGQFATFATRDGGGWRLMDKQSTSYEFDSAGRLVKVSDHRGRTQTLAYGGDGKLATVTGVGGRKLTFTWTGGHVTRVATDPVNGTALAWTYTYTGDTLTSVCAPVTAPNCTTYGYGTGSHYRTVVLDAPPQSYWRLGESSGDPAVSTLSTRLNTDNGHYSGVTLGVPGALTGTGDTAVRVTGGQSHVRLPDRALTRHGAYLAVELWFRTASGGVLVGHQGGGRLPATGANAVPALYVGTDGKLRGQFATGSTSPITSSGTVTDNQWHHVVLSGGGNTQSLYLDGKLVGTLAGTIDHPVAPYTYLGNGYTSPSWPATPGNAGYFALTGDLDEVAVYAKPLGLTAVQEHYRARAAAQQVKTVTLPSGRTHASITYDVGQDRVSQHTDRHGGTWKIGPISVTGTVENPVGAVTVTDPRNGTTTSTYDPLRGWQLTRQTDQLNKTTHYTYDLTGYLTKVTDANGHGTTFYRDVRGNMIGRVRCRDANTCHTEYFSYHLETNNPFDPRNDQLEAYLDGRSAHFLDGTFQTRWFYNAHGEQTEQSLPTPSSQPTLRGPRYTYTDGSEGAVGGGSTPAGLLETSADARGNETRYAYTAAGDLARVTDAAGLVTDYAYDEIGRPVRTQVTADSLETPAVTTTTYDGLSRPVTTTAPAATNTVTSTTHTARVTYTYDPDSNPLTEALSDTTGGDPTRTVTSTYDDYGNLATQTSPEGGVERYAYDTTGARTLLMDATGTQYGYIYTPRGELALRVVRDYTGSPLAPESARDVTLDSYAYDPAGRLAVHVDAMGRTESYVYYDDDLLGMTIVNNARLNDSTTPVNEIVDQRGYDPAGNLTFRITGGGAVRTDYSYDNASRLIRESLDPLGRNRRVAYTYDADDNVLSAERTAGSGDRIERVEFTYDPMSRVTRETVENGDTDLVTTYARDDRGLVTDEVSPRGNVSGGNPDAHRTTYRFDALGRPLEIKQPPITVHRTGIAAINDHRPGTRYGYNTAGDTTHVTDPEGRTTVTVYDRDSRATSVTLPTYTAPGAATAVTPRATTAYDDAGRPTSVTDPRGATRTTVYDQLGRPVKITDPPATSGAPSGVTTMTYDLAGELTAIVDPTGARIEATYDDLGRQVTETLVERRPTGAAYTTRHTYDLSGRLTRTTAPSGAVRQYTYNPEGDLSGEVDDLGRHTTYRYDLAGRLQRVIDPLGLAVEAEYDLAGRNTAVKDLDKTEQVLRTRRTTYDADSNPVTTVSGEGHTTTRAYDNGGRMTSLTEPVTDSKTITTTFGYDANGALTRLVDGRGNITVTSYNTLGLIQAVTESPTTAHPDLTDRTWTTSYDAAGNTTSVLQPGGVRLAYTYDALGRLTARTGTGAETATTGTEYGYDLAGRTTAISAPGGTLTVGYDDRGNPITTTAPGGVTSTSTYDGNNRLTRRVDKAGTAVYGWDGADQLTSGTDPATGQTYIRAYDDAGRLTGITYGTTGAKRVLGYDDLDRLTTDQTKSATDAVLTSATYEYNKDDQRTKEITAGVPQAGTHQYSYDRSGRLTGWTKPDGTSVDYGWDDAGNRTKVGSTTYTYDERNRLTSGAGNTYTYRPRGTLASTSSGGTTTTAQFDAFDRLVADGPVSYAYDGLGRLSQRTSGGQTTTLAYSSDANDPVAVLNSDGTATARYGRDPAGNLLATTENGTSSWTVTDPHGDRTAALNTAGTALTGAAAYDPFGAVTGTTGTGSSLGYQGEYTDPTTGRVNMHARWYTPATGGFNSRDTMTVPADPSVQGNRYTYGNADPLNHTDPTGHLSVKEITRAAAPIVRFVKPAVPAIRTIGRAVPGVNLVINVYDAAKLAYKAGQYIGTRWVRPAFSGNQAPGTATTSRCGNSCSSYLDFSKLPKPPTGTSGGSRNAGGGPHYSGGGPRYSSGGYTRIGGGYGPPSPPPPPSRKQLMLNVARTPAARPAYRPVIDQATLDRQVRATEADVTVVAAQQASSIGSGGLVLDDKPTAQERPWEKGSLATSPLRKEERGCLSGEWEGDPIRYWGLDGSGKEGVDRAMGAEACYQGALPGGGTPAAELPIAGYKKHFGLARGHLIGNKLGGDGTRYDNLIPIYQADTNVRKMFHRWEKDVARRVANEETVFYRVVPLYRGESKIPYAVSMTISSSTGYYHSAEIINQRFDVPAQAWRRDVE
ncbi:DNRLRE domain-containing protein [Cryptosporangium aurantiacum]|uniref:DNRLRE domain-containing protein n=1 Tax=Cryptosporangium aurantiacum TaxID=134849 RepID=UPI0015C099DA|nr:DNRLRE domain-containing protein [Cryptosporangium aurantiacum]